MWSDTVKPFVSFHHDFHVNLLAEHGQFYTTGRADPPVPMIAGKAAGMVHVLEHGTPWVFLQGGAPPSYVCYFIIPMNTIDITPQKKT